MCLIWEKDHTNFFIGLSRVPFSYVVGDNIIRSTYMRKNIIIKGLSNLLNIILNKYILTQLMRPHLLAGQLDKQSCSCLPKLRLLVHPYSLYPAYYDLPLTVFDNYTQPSYTPTNIWESKLFLTHLFHGLRQLLALAMLKAPC